MTEPPTTQPPPRTTGDIRITNIFYDSVVSRSEPDEIVEIRNYDNVPIKLQDWTLREEVDQIFTIPNFVLQPGCVCRIYTNEDHPESCGFSYGSGSEICNNAGDIATLRDKYGTLIDQYSY